MKEIIEARLPPDWYQEHLSNIIGAKRLSELTVSIRLNSKSDKAKLIGRLINEYENRYGAIGYCSWYDRYYTKKEINEAEFLQMMINAIFEPCGEELGTIYDESTACPICGAGRTQVNDLILNLRKIPRKRDIASSIANEWVVSDKFVRIFRDNNMTGAEFLPVIHYSNRRKNLPVYFQIKIVGTVGISAKPTKFGADPFDPDKRGKYVCPYGHVSGLSILSELYIKKENWDGSDIAVTEDMIGQRMGLLVPKPLIVISQRFYRILKKEKIRGFREEVVHVV